MNNHAMADKTGDNDMSFQAMRWATRRKVGNATGKAILLLLANYADENGVCFPSQGKLADECECSRRTVARFLAEFERRGLIGRVSRCRKDGSRTSDEIKLAVDEVHQAEPVSIGGWSFGNTPYDNVSPPMTMCHPLCVRMSQH